MTSAIARMNLFLHSIEDFRVERGDTLAEPKLTEGDSLRQFDAVLANPPYSIKQWNRAAWATDSYGRNFLGTPPQGRADYAFFQHILKSLKPDTGRCAILFPHGVLFRDEEAEMRRRLIDLDLVECVLGLGANLFYNSPMEACVVVCRMRKEEERRGRVLFIDAVGEVTRERAQSFLTEAHTERILGAYRSFADEEGFARVATLDEVREKNGNLNIPLYVQRRKGAGGDDASRAKDVRDAIAEWETSSASLRGAMDAMFAKLGEHDLEEEVVSDKYDGSVR